RQKPVATPRQEAPGPKRPLLPPNAERRVLARPGCSRRDLLRPPLPRGSRGVQVEFECLRIDDYAIVDARPLNRDPPVTHVFEDTFWLPLEGIAITAAT